MLNIINKRLASGLVKTIRTKLPRYKLDVYKLPIQSRNLLPIINKDRTILLERLEIYKTYIPSNTSTVLLEALFNPNNDIDSLLNIIDINLPSMTSFYLALSFESLDNAIQLEFCHPETILVSPEFKRLCQRTIFRLRFFESDEIVKLIKCLAILGVQEDTFVMQASLQMAKYWINDYDSMELDVMQQSLARIDSGSKNSTRLLPCLYSSLSVAREKLIEAGNYIDNKVLLEAKS